MLGAVRDRQSRPLFRIGRDGAVIERVGVSEVVDVEQLGRQAVATVVTLAPVLIDPNPHGSPRFEPAAAAVVTLPVALRIRNRGNAIVTNATGRGRRHIGGGPLVSVARTAT